MEIYNEEINPDAVFEGKKYSIRVYATRHILLKVITGLSGNYILS